MNKKKRTKKQQPLPRTGQKRLEVTNELGEAFAIGDKVCIRGVPKRVYVINGLRQSHAIMGNLRISVDQLYHYKPDVDEGYFLQPLDDGTFYPGEYDGPSD